MYKLDQESLRELRQRVLRPRHKWRDKDRPHECCRSGGQRTFLQDVGAMVDVYVCEECDMLRLFLSGAD
ncbi:MAG TPA: hypothetical protein DIC52_20430 [Candidatus Latescibacteria bacterium]|nr:hypothetical protein [Candidatus Latescibacterota bacterium]